KYIFILEIVSLFLSIHLFAQEKHDDSLHLHTIKKVESAIIQGNKSQIISLCEPDVVDFDDSIIYLISTAINNNIKISTLISKDLTLYSSIQEKYNIVILSKERGKSYTISCSFNKSNSNYLIDYILITENNKEQHEELCKNIQEIEFNKLIKKLGITPIQSPPASLNDPFRNQDIKRHNEQMKQNQLDHIQRVQSPPFPR
ncbi:MAG: hypothetical protein ACRC3B_07715, partial [Bacteroidia bacterium]